MIKPIIKPSARIASRAYATRRPNTFTQQTGALWDLTRTVTDMIDRNTKAEKWLISTVGSDHILLMQHLHGENSVLRTMLREAHDVLDSISDPDDTLIQFKRCVWTALHETSPSQKLIGKSPAGAA